MRGFCYCDIIIMNIIFYLINMESYSFDHAQKIVVIGAGAVGATVAYTLMLKNLAARIVLIDVNIQKQEGEVMDIDDVLSFVETGSISSGNFKDAIDADVIILTAGAAQKPGETRLDLINKNKTITRSIFKEIGKLKSTAIVLVVANPVDILTYLVQEVSGLDHKRVFGSGTSLDTARLRTEISKVLKVSAQNVEGYVLGEHGDTEFDAFSTVSVGGILIKDFKLPRAKLDEIESKVKNAAYDIINRKGATFYGIAMVVADIVEAILFDQRKIMPLSVRLEGWNGISGVCLSVPVVVGRQGIEKVWPVKLNFSEKIRLKKSTKEIKKFL